MRCCRSESPRAPWSAQCGSSGLPPCHCATFCLLRRVTQWCKLRGVPYQIAFGTLLGSVRGQRVLTWDYDGDVAVPLLMDKLLLEPSVTVNFLRGFYAVRDVRGGVVRTCAPHAGRPVTIELQSI